MATRFLRAKLPLHRLISSTAGRGRPPAAIQFTPAVPAASTAIASIPQKDLTTLQLASEPSSPRKTSGPLLDKSCLKPLATECVTSVRVAEGETARVVHIARKDWRRYKGLTYVVKNTKNHKEDLEGVEWLVEKDGKLSWQMATGVCTTGS